MSKFKKTKQKLLIIGWDAADWKVINPLMDSGQMPNLERLINGGVMGKIATLDPPLSPTLWTSMATGKRPFQHGIHGFTEVDPSGKGVRPVYATSRTARTFWNISSHVGYKTHVVGWWPSHPAEPINGVMVSNLYQKSNKPIKVDWDMLEGTVHPIEKEPIYKKLRVHHDELSQRMLAPFLIEPEKIDQTNKKHQQKLKGLKSTTSDAATIHAAATYILDNEDWEVMAVYYDAIDHYCHGFMKFHPPKRDHIAEDDYHHYNQVVNNGYKFHDLMLGKLMTYVDENTTVMLVSDHGFHPDENRPTKLIKDEPAAPAHEHSPYGIIVMAGPNIKKDEQIFGCSILDLTPNILTLLGLPLGKDMMGKVWINAFIERPDIDFINSWDDQEGNFFEYDKENIVSQEMSEELLNQLVELGYIEKPSKDMEVNIQSTKDNNNYFLSRSYMDAGMFDEAMPLLKEMYERTKNTRFAWYLVKCYQGLNLPKRALEIIDKIANFTDKKTPRLAILEGFTYIINNKPKKALKKFKEAENLSDNFPGLGLQIAKGYFQLRKWDKVVQLLEKEVVLNPEDQNVLQYLGIAHFRIGNYNESLDALIDAIGLQFSLPQSHYYVGLNLMKLEDHKSARNSFNALLKMAPKFSAARDRLREINKIEGITSKSTNEELKGLNVKNITIVSGLPRSGTSLMMQMLDAAGLEILTDNNREADGSNPKGYLEHEGVKALATNRKVLINADGKVVKIISHLLQHLPTNHNYKIVFMDRPMDEVMNSQHKMLVRSGKAKESEIHFNMLNAMEIARDKAIKRLQNKVNIEFEIIDYHKLLFDFEKVHTKLEKLLDVKLDAGKMKECVDLSLYREKQNVN